MPSTTISQNVPGLDKGIAAGQRLAPSKSIFPWNLAAGATIATLNDPFGSGSTFATAGTVPAQLALSGGAIVKGAGAAVVGAEYIIRVMATSADGQQETSARLTFGAVLEFGGVFTPGAGGGVVATAIGIVKSGDGSVGQTYTATVAPIGAPIQWTRTTKGASPVTTDITGATGLTYVATVDDVGFYLGVRGQFGSVSARSIGWVLPASILLESFDSISGFSTNTGYVNTIDTARKTQGTGAMQVNRKVTQSSDVITTKAITGLDPANMDIMVVDHWHDRSFSEVQVTAGVQEAGGTLIVATNNNNLNNDLPPCRIPLLLDTADVSGKSTGIVNGTVYVRDYGKSPNMSKPIFDAIRVKARGIPTVVPYWDDGFRAPLTILGQYAKDRGIVMTFAIPTNNLQSTVNGSGYLANSDIATILALGHRVIPNISPDDAGPDQSQYALMNQYITAMNSGRAILRGLGVPEEMLAHGVFSNGIGYVQGQKQRVSDAVYDGVGGVTLTATPTIAPVVGMTYRGWDVTTGLPVESTITAVASPTAFTTSYAYPVNSTTNSKLAIYFSETEYSGRKMPTRLAAEGMKTARLTSNWDVRLPTRFGIPDPLWLPSQSFSNTAAAGIIAGSSTVAKKYGCTVAYYDHNTQAGSGAPTDAGIGHWEADIKAVMDSQATDIQAGNLQVLSPDLLLARDGVAGLL